MRIAIIPARGGSKRIPRKNIKPFHGKPIIAYSIEAAIASGCFDKVIVSTDDLEIAVVAKQFGADVPFMRPSDFSDDHATTMDVIQHAILWCEESGMSISNVCCLYATAPFVTPEFLQEGLKILQQEKCEFAFSATRFSFPIQRAIKLSEHGEVSMFLPENEQVRSQDLEEAYHDAGQFYWGSKSAFLERKAVFAPHSRVILLPRNCVQDIDIQEDWAFSESLFSLMKQS